jgi:hypothetical protein
MPHHVAPAPTLTDAQRCAVALAEGTGWRIIVEAADGSRLRLRQGHPARNLVLLLGPGAQAADERTLQAERVGL